MIDFRIAVLALVFMGWMPGTASGASPDDPACHEIVSTSGEIATLFDRHKAANEKLVAEHTREHFAKFQAILEEHGSERGRLEVMDQVTGLIARSRPTFDRIQDSEMAMKDMQAAGRLGEKTAQIVYNLRARSNLVLNRQSASLMQRWFGWLPFFNRPSVLWQMVKDRSRGVDEVLDDIDQTVKDEIAKTDEIKQRHDTRMRDLKNRELLCEDYAKVMEANAQLIRSRVQSQFEAGSQPYKLFGIVADTYDEEANRYFALALRYAESGQKGDALTLFVLKFKRVLQDEAMLAKASLEGGAMAAEAAGQLQNMADLSKAYRQAANEADLAFSLELEESAKTLQELSRDHSADALRRKAEAAFESATRISAEVERERVENSARRRQDMQDRLYNIRHSDEVLRVSAEQALSESGLVGGTNDSDSAPAPEADEP